MFSVKNKLFYIDEKDFKKGLDFLERIRYNINVDLWRDVRAGRRSTIGNRVYGYNRIRGSNPRLSATKRPHLSAGRMWSFFKRIRVPCGTISIPSVGEALHLAEKYIIMRMYRGSLKLCVFGEKITNDLSAGVLRTVLLFLCLVAC